MIDLHGAAPWFSIEAAPDEMVLVAHLPYPSENDVSKCMNCPYAECRDCIGKNKSYFKESHRPPVYDTATIRRLVYGGSGYESIMRELGCSESTARRYVKKFIKSA